VTYAITDATITFTKYKRAMVTYMDIFTILCFCYFVE